MNDDFYEEDDWMKIWLLDHDEPAQSGIESADSNEFGLDPNFREALKTNEDFRQDFKYKCYY